MSIDFNVRENDLCPHDQFCDYCGDFIMKLDDGYITHFSMNTERPKISSVCKKCRDYERLNNFRRGCIVKGYGRVPIEFLDKKDAEMDTKVETKSKKIVELNWGDIDAQIKGGAAKLKDLSKQYKVEPGILRDLLNERYPNQLEYRRGRNGGIRLNTQPK